MMNAFRMRMETRNAKRKAVKAQKKEAKQETKKLLNSCKTFAQSGLYQMECNRHYGSGGIRNAVAYNLRQKGYKVETTNLKDSYVITSVSWVKVKSNRK